MTAIFADLDLASFWRDDPSGYYASDYGDDPLTAEKLALVEERLGCKLPAAYVELMRSKNGGAPRKTRHPSPSRTTWADDHIEMTGFFSIGGLQSEE